MIETKTLVQTTAETNLWVDGADGDDKNDGLDESRPKKGFIKALNGLPYVIAHNTCVHLKNNHDYENNPYVSTPYIRKHIKANVMLLIDGGDDKTIVSGPFTATGSTTDSLTATTPGWTTDSIGGYWVEILSGPCTGEIRQIQLNTTTIVYVSKYFSQDPGLCNFRIVRPTTTFGKLGSTTYWFVFLRTTGPGLVQIQRLYSEDDYSYMGGNYNQRIYASHLVCNPPSCNVFQCTRYKETMYDPTTFQPVTTSAAGVRGSLHAATNYQKHIIEGGYTTTSISTSGIGQTIISKGFRMRGETGSAPTIYAAFGEHVLIDGSDSGYRPNRVSEKVTLAPFLYASGGLLELKAPLHLYNGSAGGGNAVSQVLKHGVLFFNGVVVGTGNVEGPVILRYANGVLKTLAGSPPTVTGTYQIYYGDGLEFTSTTWAVIEAGTDLPGLQRGNFVMMKVAA